MNLNLIHILGLATEFQEIWRMKDELNDTQIQNVKFYTPVIQFL